MIQHQNDDEHSSSSLPSLSASGQEVFPHKEKKKFDFPYKLHQLLEDAEAEGNNHIVSWTNQGTAFCIHKRPEFATKILPRYYNRIKLRSFSRQLNIYGFERKDKGNSKYASTYAHKWFIQDEHHLCSRMVRVIVKSKSPPHQEPPTVVVPRSLPKNAVLDGAPPAPSALHSPNDQDQKKSSCNTFMPLLPPQNNYAASLLVVASAPDMVNEEIKGGIKSNTNDMIYQQGTSNKYKGQEFNKIISPNNTLPSTGDSKEKVRPDPFLVQHDDIKNTEEHLFIEHAGEEQDDTTQNHYLLLNHPFVATSSSYHGKNEGVTIPASNHHRNSFPISNFFKQKKQQYDCSTQQHLSTIGDDDMICPGLFLLNGNRNQDHQQHGDWQDETMSDSSITSSMNDCDLGYDNQVKFRSGPTIIGNDAPPFAITYTTTTYEKNGKIGTTTTMVPIGKTTFSKNGDDPTSFTTMFPLSDSSMPSTLGLQQSHVVLPSNSTSFFYNHSSGAAPCYTRGGEGTTSTTTKKFANTILMEVNHNQLTSPPALPSYVTNCWITSAMSQMQQQPPQAIMNSFEYNDHCMMFDANDLEPTPLPPP